MTESFNKLSCAEAELLALLAEECGEVVQIVGKILRHGYESCNPDSGESNRMLLHKELGDMQHIVRRMITAEDLILSLIEEAAEAKAERVKQYLHHQECTQ